MHEIKWEKNPPDSHGFYFFCFLADEQRTVVVPLQVYTGPGGVLLACRPGSQQISVVQDLKGAWRAASGWPKPPGTVPDHQWTDKIPAKPGYYFCCCMFANQQQNVVIAEVFENTIHELRAFIPGHRISFKIDELNAFWKTPVTQPLGLSVSEFKELTGLKYPGRFSQTELI